MQEKDTSQIYETVDMVEVTRSNGLEDYYLKKNKMIHDNFLHLLETAESRSAFCETVESSLHSLIYIVVAGVLLLSTNFNGNISDYIISHKFIVGSQSESTAAVTSDYKKHSGIR